MKNIQHPSPDTRHPMSYTSFKSIFDQYNWDETLSSILTKTEEDVKRALQSPKRGLEDFKALLSPAAKPFLETMAQMSSSIT